MNGLVSEIEAANILNLSVQTLRNWRNQRKGPPYVKIGRAVRYQMDDVSAYIDRHKVEPRN